jgi:hypothetical protein
MACAYFNGFTVHTVSSWILQTSRNVLNYTQFFAIENGSKGKGRKRVTALAGHRDVTRNIRLLRRVVMRMNPTMKHASSACRNTAFRLLKCLAINR